MHDVLYKTSHIQSGDMFVEEKMTKVFFWSGTICLIVSEREQQAVF
jgi:hypothetical protein